MSFLSSDGKKLDPKTFKTEYIVSVLVDITNKVADMPPSKLKTQLQRDRRKLFKILVDRGVVKRKSKSKSKKSRSRSRSKSQKGGGHNVKHYTWSKLDTKNSINRIKSKLNKLGYKGNDILEYILDGNVRADKKSYRSKRKLDVFIEKNIRVQLYNLNGNDFIQVWGTSPKLKVQVYKKIKLSGSKWENDLKN